MALKGMQANVARLQAILAFLEQPRAQPLQINLATFLATHRTDESRAPVGCVLGHYARTSASSVISLIPMRFWQQAKSPIMVDALRDEYPQDHWQHWTLRYQTLRHEAYGETAALLYLQMGQWDCHRLFYPAGSSYEVRPPLDSLVFRLRSMVETSNAVGGDRGS